MIVSLVIVQQEVACRPTAVAVRQPPVLANPQHRGSAAILFTPAFKQVSALEE